MKFLGDSRSRLAPESESSSLFFREVYSFVTNSGFPGNMMRPWRRPLLGSLVLLTLILVLLTWRYFRILWWTH